MEKWRNYFKFLEIAIFDCNAITFLSFFFIEGKKKGGNQDDGGNKPPPQDNSQKSNDNPQQGRQQPQQGRQQSQQSGQQPQESRQQSRPQQSGNSQKSQQKVHKEWNCSSCGYLNYSKNVQCRQCSVPKNASQESVSGTSQQSGPGTSQQFTERPQKQPKQVILTLYFILLHINN